MEQQWNSNKDKMQDLYAKTSNTAPFFSGISKEGTMLMEQSVWYGRDTLTPNQELLNEET